MLYLDNSICLIVYSNCCVYSQTPQADNEEFDSESESIGSSSDSDEDHIRLRQAQIASMQTLRGASTSRPISGDARDVQAGSDSRDDSDKPFESVGSKKTRSVARPDDGINKTNDDLPIACIKGGK